MTINDRIKDIRRSTGLSQTDFAERLGTTRGVITNLEGEKTTPNEPFIKLICREFNIDEHWLRTGEGEMRQKLTRNQEIAEFMGVLPHDHDDTLTMEKQRLKHLKRDRKKNGRGRITVPGLFFIPAPM